MTWAHDDLLDDLASHLAANGKRMIWRDLQLGPSHSMRPDVFTIDRSFSSPRPTAFEIKISRKDFRSDITSGKYLKYSAAASRVVFAAPAGLIDLAELPAQCGLIVRTDKVWRFRRNPVTNGARPDFDMMLKLLMDGVDREGPGRRLRGFNEYRAQKAIAKRYGQEVADVVRNVSHAKAQAELLIESAQQRADKIREGAVEKMPDVLKVIAETLDLDLATIHAAHIPLKIRQAIEHRTGATDIAAFNGHRSAALRDLRQAQNQLAKMIGRLDPAAKP